MAVDYSRFQLGTDLSQFSQGLMSGMQVRNQREAQRQKLLQDRNKALAGGTWARDKNDNLVFLQPTMGGGKGLHVQQTAAPEGVTPASRIGLTSQQQLEQEYQKRINQLQAELDLASGKADAKADETRKVEAEKTKAAAERQKQEDKIAREETWYENAISGAEGLMDIDRAFHLLDVTETSGLEASKAAAANFFGVETDQITNITELNSLVAEQVLAGLANFKGAISDSERGFVEQMSARIAQGKSITRRQLDRLQREYERNVRRGRRVAESREDADMLYELDLLAGERDKYKASWAKPNQKKRNKPKQNKPQMDDSSYQKGRSAILKDR